MEYVLTQPPRDALEKRQIMVAWMERALTLPEVTEADPVNPDLEHRLARLPEFGNCVLRVIVNGKRTPSQVVTVPFDRRRTIP